MQLVVPRVFQHIDFPAYTDQVIEQVQALEPNICGNSDTDDCIVGLSVGLKPLIPSWTVTQLPVLSAEPVSPEGEPVPPEVAAERVLEVLGDTRRAGAQEPEGEEPGGEEPGADEPGAEEPGADEPGAAGEPLGVLVSADVELVGLRGRPVLLSWSMWQAGGEQRLFGEWLNENLAFRLEATTDHDATTLDLWIPLPKQPGSYFIRLQLTADEFRLARADSEPFE